MTTPSLYEQTAKEWIVLPEKQKPSLNVIIHAQGIGNAVRKKNGYILHALCHFIVLLFLPFALVWLMC